MFLSFTVSYSIVIIISFFFVGRICETTKKGLPLNDYIHHFEPLFYDHRHLQEQHRRSTMEQQFSFQFAAHDRLFRLRLNRDLSVFAEDTEFENTLYPVRYDTSRALTGHVEDEEESSVEAVVTVSGLLDGVVKVGGEEFYIEPAENYLQPPHDFHSVIYKLSDVRFPSHNLTCLAHLIHPFADRLSVPSSKNERAKQFSWSYDPSENCCAPKKSKAKDFFHKAHSRFTYFHHKHNHRVEEAPVLIQDGGNSVNSKQKGKQPKIRHASKSQYHHHHHHHHHHRTHNKLTKHFVRSSNTIVNKKKSESLRLELDSLLYHPVSGKSKSSSSQVRLSTDIVTFNVKPMSSATYKVPYSTTKDFRSIRNGLFHTNLSVYSHERGNWTMYSDSAVEINDDSHEDHSGSYSNSSQFAKEMTRLPEGAANTPASDIEDLHFSMRGLPELDVDIDYKKKDSTNLSSNRRDTSRSEDLPYWRELDALHYTEDGRTGSSEPYGVRSIQRTQWTEDRGQRHVAVDRRKSTCLLYLQADHLFYQKMGSEEACIEAMTRHVQRVNSIYRSTDFDQDGRPDNISFLIKRIKVHTSPEHSDYRFVGNYGVEKFLELFSEDDYDAFCLAYMFTYRDFEGGTLGLAWTGDLKNAGGVCEKNGHYRGSLKSLNTGIITLLNYGKHVPPVVSHVTLAHEIGHNFGSPHDPEDDQHCTPGGEHGNYIMFARATSGDKRNNNRFSPCSLRSINAVLNTKARSVKGCFTEPLDAVCGNEVVEGTEECDCGWEEDCHEPCCFPMRVNPPQDQPPCRLRPAAFCSPSQGPCCSHDCRLKYGVMCREDNGCRTASYCDGQGPQCPPSTKKPNKTVCSEEFVCYNGECTGSICMAYGLESCQCLRTIHDPLIRSCELCCKLPGDELSCKSSFEWNLAPYDVPDLYAKPGAPCDNYNGYCDVHQSCREIDPSGPLATLRKLLLSPEGAVILRRWLAERWWGILLLLLAIALTVAISARLLSRGHSKNFLSTILPHQSDFHFCHSRSSARSRPTYLVTNNLRKTRCVPRPRVSSAPENGWV